MDTHCKTSLWKRSIIALATVISIASCDDNGVSPAQHEIAAFSQQLQGNWTLDKVTVYSAKETVTIAPVKEFACDKLSKTFQAKDVVNKYSITYSDNVLHVAKYYTCRLAPEELSWRLELVDGTGGESINWMSGKNFKIQEINEATLTAELRLAFFNLDGCSPDGKPATSATSNKLWLEVEYDAKEASTFRLEFSKAQ